MLATERGNWQLHLKVCISLWRHYAHSGCVINYWWQFGRDPKSTTRSVEHFSIFMGHQVKSPYVLSYENQLNKLCKAAGANSKSFKPSQKFGIICIELFLSLQIISVCCATSVSACQQLLEHTVSTDFIIYVKYTKEDNILLMINIQIHKYITNNNNR